DVLEVDRSGPLLEVVAVEAVVTAMQVGVDDLAAELPDPEEVALDVLDDDADLGVLEEVVVGAAAAERPAYTVVGVGDVLGERRQPGRPLAELGHDHATDAVAIDADRARGETRPRRRARAGRVEIERHDARVGTLGLDLRDRLVLETRDLGRG